MATLPEGLLIELVTPLTPTGALDTAGLSRLFQHIAPWTVAVVAGTPGVGEALELPPALRQELFAALLELMPPTLPLVFGITGGTAAETQDLAQHLEAIAARQAAGHPLFWLDLPLWWHSNRGLPQVYGQLGGTLRHPLVLMNHPHLIRSKGQPLKHVNLRTAVLKRLTQVPQVAGLVYHGDMRRFLHYYAAAAGRPDFLLYEADEQRFLIRPGARGLVSAGAQLLPRTWHQVAQACLFLPVSHNEAGVSSQTWELSRYLLALQELYHLQPAALLKQGLYQLGILPHPNTWPSTPAFPAHLGAQLEALLASRPADER